MRGKKIEKSYFKSYSLYLGFIGIILGLILLAATLISVRAASPMVSSFFTVNSAGDEPDDNTADGICQTLAGTCTLRAAIMEANTNPNSTINFNIGTGGTLSTITPSSAFDTITQPVTIDGTSQPGYVGSPLIELNGTNIPAGVNGLTISGGNSTIKGLVINRFSGSGIELVGRGNNTIGGNYIGTDATGQVSSGNTNYGIWLHEVPNNTIGGVSNSTRNIISGNFNYGINIGGNGSTGNRVQGNYIGTDAAGLASVPNSSGGVCICGGSTTTVGGTSAAARNIISGNNSYGISIEFTGAINNVVQGNYIGTNVSGTTALPNTISGVYITNAPNNLIGGGISGAGNFISGNSKYGILISNSNAVGNTVQGNFIGLKPSDMSQLGNGLNGIMLDNSASNTIGGTIAGQDNTIAYNNGAGIFVNSGTGHRVQRNSIFSNAGLGIDLAPAGVTLNDAGDPDSGPNNLQNFPVINSITDNTGTTTINGTLYSTPNTSFALYFFSNVSCDSTGYGEGQSYLTNQGVATDGSGAGNFSVSLPTPSTGRFIAVTATDANNQSTSEFSACNKMPVITTQPMDYSINLDNSVMLSVVVDGTPGFFYQWYQINSDNSQTLIPGATQNTYTTPNLTAPTRYQVRITNFAGYVDSRIATVNVSCLFVTQPTDNGSKACGTLSGAIQEANAAVNDATISFFVSTVTINGSLDRVHNVNSKSIKVDGGCTIQNGSGIPGVEIQAGVGANANGLSLGSNVKVTGVKITGFQGYAIDVQGNANEITCNWLGTRTGTTAAGNGGGIQLGTANVTSANNNNIGLPNQPASGNVISGNSGANGIKVNNGFDNQLHYNLIGFATDGSVLRNSGGAISILKDGNLKFGLGNRINA